MTTSASIPYTCGELFQGTLDGQPCLVSCPIEIFSTARIISNPARQYLPRKSRLALESLRRENRSLPLISLLQRLPSGRGYGTSTADIGSVLYTAAHFAGMSLSTVESARMAVAIEPTDSTFFPGLALFDHRQAIFHRNLGNPPPVSLVILDPGGKVDSESFNSHDWKPKLAQLASQHRQSFELLQKGIDSQDISTIGEAATLSALAHQEILYNPLLDETLALARETGAAGICRAHSGTVIGLLFAKASFDEREVVACLRKRIPARVRLRVTELTGGGPRFAGPVHTSHEEMTQ